jgi:hypothetical protein
MNVITIIALVFVAVLGYLWFRKPSLKGIKARTLLASRDRPVAKPRLP